MKKSFYHDSIRSPPPTANKNALMPQSMKKLSFAFQICIESEGKIAVKLL